MEPLNSYKQILVVDDDPGLRAVLSLFLRDEGYVVHTAENGEEALALLVSVHPQVILTDLNMPVMNGWDFIAAKQTDSKLRSIPVIVCSAESRSLALDGVTCFIPKPFPLDALIALIKKLSAHKS